MLSMLLGYIIGYRFGQWAERCQHMDRVQDALLEGIVAGRKSRNGIHVIRITKE